MKQEQDIITEMGINHIVFDDKGKIIYIAGKTTPKKLLGR